MSAFAFRRILPLLVIGSLAFSSCVVRERRPDYGYNDNRRHDRHDHDHDRHDDHDHHD